MRRQKPKLKIHVDPAILEPPDRRRAPDFIGFLTDTDHGSKWGCVISGKAAIYLLG